jgi:predicted nucleotidyltransferase/DNA-binding XRE family transcriptional regulator
MVSLKTLRQKNGLSQREAAKKTGVSLRSYIDYENDESKVDTIKYRYLVNTLKDIVLVDEEHGLLTTETIIKICEEVFRNKGVDFCYLFGSYAKGTARENSDVDLLICTGLSGLKYFGIAEDLREALQKKVDLLDYRQLLNNEELLKEVLKTGVKIYG